MLYQYIFFFLHVRIGNGSHSLGTGPNTLSMVYGAHLLDNGPHIREVIGYGNGLRTIKNKFKKNMWTNSKNASSISRFLTRWLCKLEKSRFKP